MTIEEKQEALEQLGVLFVDFMTKLTQIPGARIQKQRAFVRFDEGHLWFQNAILNCKGLENEDKSHDE